MIRKHTAKDGKGIQVANTIFTNTNLQVLDANMSNMGREQKKSSKHV